MVISNNRFAEGLATEATVHRSVGLISVAPSEVIQVFPTSKYFDFMGRIDGELHELTLTLNEEAGRSDTQGSVYLRFCGWPIRFADLDEGQKRQTLAGILFYHCSCGWEADMPTGMRTPAKFIPFGSRACIGPEVRPKCARHCEV